MKDEGSEVPTVSLKPDYDTGGENPDARKVGPEELHPGSHDQVAARRKNAEEVAIEHLAGQDPPGAMKEHPLVTQGGYVAEVRDTKTGTERDDNVEQWISKQ